MNGIIAKIVRAKPLVFKNHNIKYAQVIVTVRTLENSRKENSSLSFLFIIWLDLFAFDSIYLHLTLLFYLL